MEEVFPGIQFENLLRQSKRASWNVSALEELRLPTRCRPWSRAFQRCISGSLKLLLIDSFCMKTPTSGRIYYWPSKRISACGTVKGRIEYHDMNLICLRVQKTSRHWHSTPTATRVWINGSTIPRQWSSKKCGPRHWVWRKELDPMLCFAGCVRYLGATVRICQEGESESVLNTTLHHEQ